MQLGKTGFIQLHLAPELHGQFWAVVFCFGPALFIFDIASSSGKKWAFDGNRPTLILSREDSFSECSSATGSVNYLTMYGFVMFMFCL